MIKEFKGENSWLSNFAFCQIKIGDRTFPSVEHAYMSEKSDNPTWKHRCTGGKAGDIKKESRLVDLVADWDVKRIHVMRACLEQKFKIPYFKEKLLASYGHELVEGNWWHDNFWGYCNCMKCSGGKNMLGKMIMEIREKIKSETQKGKGL